MKLEILSGPTERPPNKQTIAQRTDSQVRQLREKGVNHLKNSFESINNDIHFNH